MAESRDGYGYTRSQILEARQMIRTMNSRVTERKPSKYMKAALGIKGSKRTVGINTLYDAIARKYGPNMVLENIWDD